MKKWLRIVLWILLAAGVTTALIFSYQHEQKKKIKNPKTGNTIKFKSALGFDEKSPLFQAAKQMLVKNKT
jgi:hypothetical protein